MATLRWRTWMLMACIAVVLLAVGVPAGCLPGGGPSRADERHAGPGIPPRAPTAQPSARPVEAIRAQFGLWGSAARAHLAQDDGSGLRWRDAYLLGILICVVLAAGSALVLAFLLGSARKGTMPVLWLTRGRAASPVVPLSRPVTLIGRHPSCRMMVSDRWVSRRHAQILHTGSSYVLTDLNSTNGTYVNGKRVQNRLLHPGDVVRVGGTQFVFQWLRRARRRAPARW